MFDLEYRLFMEDFMKPVARVLSPYISPNQTTIIGFVFGLLSCLFNYYSVEYLSFICFLLNRVLDCVDGIIARISNRQSDFGGYLDIIVDFIIYALLPLTSVLSSPSYNSFVLLAVLLSSYYVNSASLFMLSAILEKRNLGSKAKGEKTTVNMPPAFIEGVETYIVYFLLISLPWAKVISMQDFIFISFAVAVFYNVGQRLHWAYFNLVD